VPWYWARVRLAGLACLLLASLATGCGSTSGEGSGRTDPAFVGRWLGPFSATGKYGPQTGTADVTIAENGKLTGIMQNATLGEQGSFSGSIDQAGHVTGSYSYPGYSATGSGHLLIQQNGHLAGAIETFEAGTKVGTSTVDLEKQ
jgi:hypothetical protein